jgi:uncharacterized damage-inducible protein DinB
MSQRSLPELLRGKGAHVDPLACVEDISAETAARQVAGFPHSIGALVYHMNFWMGYDLRRLRGEQPAYPQHNAESFPSSPSPAGEKDWDRLRDDFARFIAEHVKLAESSREELERAVEPTNHRHIELSSTLEAVLWQTVGHNSYHVGQIAMIRRMLGAWPPKAGGDSW